jgi:hypothetical protein
MVTVLGVVLEVGVEVDVVVVVDELDRLAELGVGGLEADHAIAREVLEVVHESLALVVDQLGEGSSQPLIALYERLGLLELDDVVLRGVLGRRDLVLLDLLPLVDLLVALDVGLEGHLELRLDVEQFLLLVGAGVEQREDCLVVEAQLEQPQRLPLVGDEVDDVVLAVVHLLLVVLRQPSVEHQVVVQRLHVRQRQDLGFDGWLDVGALHEVGICDFVAVVEVPLRQSRQRSNFVDSQLVLVLLEDIEQVFIEDSLRQRLQDFEMRVVSVAEAGVDEGLVVDRPHAVEEVEGGLGALHGLLAGVVEFLHGEDDCLVEVEDAQVVEAAEDVEVDVVLHELQLRVERIVPHYLQVVHHLPVLLVPVQPLAHDQREPHVHLNRGDVLVHDLDRRLVVRKTRHLVPQLRDLRHRLPESQRCLRRLRSFQVVRDGLDEVSRVGPLEGVVGLHK